MCFFSLRSILIFGGGSGSGNGTGNGTGSGNGGGGDFVKYWWWPLALKNTSETQDFVTRMNLMNNPNQRKIYFEMYHQVQYFSTFPCYVSSPSSTPSSLTSISSFSVCSSILKSSIHLNSLYQLCYKKIPKKCTKVFSIFAPIAITICLLKKNCLLPFFIWIWSDEYKTTLVQQCQKNTW